MATRIVLGSETDDTKHLELDRTNTKVSVPVSMYDASGNRVSIPSGLVSSAFDSIALGYDNNSNITSVVYKLSGVIVTTLILTYTGGNLTSIIKS